MQLLLAFDSFKESLSSLEAARCFQAGFETMFPDAKVVTLLLSDGGEGFVDALIFQQGDLHFQTVTGPLGTPVAASYGWIPQSKTAVIEMATASGLELVPASQRNPLKTTSYGTGELIQTALQHGGQQLYIGIGGSATVDGGMGMAQALGVQFFDKAGNLLPPPLTGNDLLQIGHIDLDSLSSQCQHAQWCIACDVNNPWKGPQGAAKIFGPQKGATPAMVEQLEAGMENLAEVIQKDLGKSIQGLAGGGAAGGIGGMLYALFNAHLKSGIEIVLEHLHFEDYAQQSDLIVTGEGKIDAQTLGGKTLMGVANIAKKFQTPVLAIGGTIIEEDLPCLYEAGISATMPLVATPMPLKEAIQNGAKLMQQTGERVARLLHLLPMPN